MKSAKRVRDCRAAPAEGNGRPGDRSSPLRRHDGSADRRLGGTGPTGESERRDPEASQGAA